MILEKVPDDTGAVKKLMVKSGLGKEKKVLESGTGLSVCVTQMIIDSGIADYHLMQDDITGNQRLNNLQELINAASLYEGNASGLLEFLEHIELDRSLEDKNVRLDGNDENRVTLITFHNTKGLEFRKVIMTGIEQGVFPREDKKGEELEEERRLFYVGATRAMDELYLSSCAMRRMFGRSTPLEPSAFLREIDKSSLKIVGTVPRSFGAVHKSGGSSGGHRKHDTPQWQKGQRLFHDDHGYGQVTDVRDSEEGPVVKVKFETGNELQFLGEHQGSAFVEIGNDY